MNRFPLIITTLKVTQTFEDFYAVSISAYDLLKITFSDPLRYEDETTLVGHQRKIDYQNRVKEITSYIQGVDFAFPNSIIITANYTEKGVIEDNEELRWKIEMLGDNKYNLVIPTDMRLASIIDGQHRLEGFRNTTEDFQKKTQLLVSVYFDLPNPYQAYLFATINYNQKPVDKSLALEQYGFQTNVLPINTWSPELLAVFLTKKFNFDDESPFKGRIKMAPIGSELFLNKNIIYDNWSISTACLVRGILTLISINPRNDSNELKKYEVKFRNRNQLNIDNSPLREFYLNSNDTFIFKAILNFFNSVNNKIFKSASNESFIKKSVGIDALFQVLKTILSERLKIDKNASVEYFDNYVNKFSSIDFSNAFFSPSGTGTGRIANTILIALTLKKIESIKKDSDREEILNILPRN
jgi:DNA phosphorothioation-associated DGQHR protein 1